MPLLPPSLVSEVEVGSMEALSEREGVVSPTNHPISSVSEPASPTSKPRVHTMPNNKRKVGFFKSGKHQSKVSAKPTLLLENGKVKDRQDS